MQLRSCIFCGQTAPAYVFALYSFLSEISLLAQEISSNKLGIDVMGARGLVLLAA